MEVCGTHTAAITRAGLRSALASAIEFRSGPGCPVCVTAEGDLQGVACLRSVPSVILASPGDLMRVPLPGGEGSLQAGVSDGRADARVVLSPVEAVRLAAANPRSEVVMLALGFETTSPTTAAAMLRAREQDTGNFTVLTLHKLMPPALRAILAGERGAGGPLVDGLLLPGHVSVVTGRKAFDFVARETGTPAVVAGFEASDLLSGIESLLAQIETGVPEVANAYLRAVSEHGNRAAQAVTALVFEPCPAEWRGFGRIGGSGLALREEFAEYDARRRFDLEGAAFPAPPSIGEACRCGDVVSGRLDPAGCALFGKACVPERPRGPCMVSSEGACQIALAAGEDP